MDLPDVLTTEQLARLLDCTTQTVEERTRARELPGLKFGRSWVFPRSAVLQVLTVRALAECSPATAGVENMPRQAPAPMALKPKRRKLSVLGDPPASL